MVRENRIPQIYICKICNKEFLAEKNNTRPRKYCSKKCQGEGVKMGFKSTCHYCGIEIYVQNYKKNQDRHYCSNDCKFKENGIQNIGKTPPNKNHFTRNCLICGKEFLVTHTNRKHKYCSRECGFKRPQNIAKKGNYKPCKTCNKEFYVTPSQENRAKYCSTDCMYKDLSVRFNGRKHTEETKQKLTGLKHSEETRKKQSLAKKGKPNWRKGKLTITIKQCPVCNIKFASDFKNRHKYCSQKCKETGSAKESKTRLKSGKENPNYIDGKSIFYPKEFRKMKKFIKEIYKECSLCFKEKPLAIHHIDYDKNNNDIKNLIPLCHSCHSKTNHKRNECQEFLEVGVEGLYVL